MNRYEVSWFDHCWWKHRTHEILAESEDQARKYVDKLTKLEYRYKPTYGLGDREVDSLEIKVWEDNIKLPYVLHKYGDFEY